MFISEDIKYVGVNDHELDLFEGLYKVPNGMAYNSYIIIDEKIAAYLKENQITTKPYDAIYEYVPTISADASVLMNGSTVNYRIANSLPKTVKVVDKPNPTELMKAIKNPTEVDNIRNAHVKDGVAYMDIYVHAAGVTKADAFSTF